MYINVSTETHMHQQWWLHSGKGTACYHAIFLEAIKYQWQFNQRVDHASLWNMMNGQERMHLSKCLHIVLLQSGKVLNLPSHI